MTPAEIAELASLAGLGIARPEVAEHVAVHGSDPVLPSRFHIGEAAALAMTEAAHAGLGLSGRAGQGDEQGPLRSSAVDGACAIISFALQRIDDEAIPRTNQSNPFVRPYRCGDGRWVFIHGGFPSLAAGLADLLGVRDDADRPTVAKAIERWTALDLEQAIGDSDLCGIMLRTEEEWLAHPQGIAVGELETVSDRPVSSGSGSFGTTELPWVPTDPRRPLKGLRVLDLTRVLAGPTCGRTLAAFGADVLQVTGPEVPNVPSFVIDTGHGKRRAIADFKDPVQLAELRALAQLAHVVVQGYRPGVIERYGLDAASLRSDGWNGVYGSISCFGTVGPFRHRAGWEQLAQSISGIALAEGKAPGESPTLMPAAATDYTTGLLLAGRIMRVLEAREAADVEASLCQTAMWLLRAGADLDPTAAVGIGLPRTDRQPGDFGVIDRLGFGVEAAGLDIGWEWSSHRLDRDRLSFGE